MTRQAWYQAQAEEHAVGARYWMRASKRLVREDSLAFSHARLAAHFGRLALGQSMLLADEVTISVVEATMGDWETTLGAVSPLP